MPDKRVSRTSESRLTDLEATKRVDQIHRGMARIIDALNPLRNQSSMAHPNDVLLDEPEAMLAINCVCTPLRYLNGCWLSYLDPNESLCCILHQKATYKISAKAKELHGLLKAPV